MADMTSNEVELVHRFAEETDVIALGSAALDCAEQLATLQDWFDAECARMWDGGADLGAAAKSNP